VFSVTVFKRCSTFIPLEERFGISRLTFSLKFLSSSVSFNATRILRKQEGQGVVTLSQPSLFIKAIFFIGSNVERKWSVEWVGVVPQHPHPSGSWRETPSLLNTALVERSYSFEVPWRLHPGKQAIPPFSTPAFPSPSRLPTLAK